MGFSDDFWNDLLNLKKKLTSNKSTTNKSTTTTKKSTTTTKKNLVESFYLDLARDAKKLRELRDDDDDDDIAPTVKFDDEGEDDFAPIRSSLDPSKSIAGSAALNPGSALKSQQATLDYEMTHMDEKESAKKKDNGKKLDFFEKGAFSDGYQFGDVTKTILGTVGDAGLGVVKGIAKVGEGISDLASYGVAGVADAMGNDISADRWRVEAAENKIDKWTGGADNFLDKYSVLGRTTNSIAEGVGQAAASVSAGGLTKMQWVPVLLQGLSSAGHSIGEAYKGGATDGEATVYGVSAGVIDAVSEMIFGGMGKGVKALGFSEGLSSADDILAKKISSKLSNQIAKNFTEFGIKAGAEGTEEVLAGIGQAIAKKATYMSDEEFSKILSDENLLEQFVVGAVTSGITQSGDLIQSNKNKTDFITGNNQNEQAVIDKEVENRIAEMEKNGTKLTAKQKQNIAEQVQSDMEKGYISTDTIEEVLGGDEYKTYKDTIDNEDSLQAQYDELYKLKDRDKSDEDRDRQAELKKQLDDLRTNFNRNESKMKLSDSVFDRVKDSRLAESYNEMARRHSAFEADLSKYDEKQQATIQKAIDSGILNNTNRTHEFVDMVAKISADKGVLFDFANNQKLKESGFAVDGKSVNGYVTKDGITVNVQSAKSLNSVVGHEITHVLEGTELYTELQNAVVQYAKTKGDYQGRYDSLAKLYENVEGANVDAELTADLVGDYLFTDADFINNLSTNHRNVFQKIYDEVKYLLKVATAGSKEARELEKVKRAFEKAYQESQTETNEATDAEVDDVQYSISVTDKDTLDSLNEQVSRGEYDPEKNPDGGYYVTYKSMSFWGYDEDGNAILRSPMAEYVDGELSNAYLIPKDKSKLNWYQATETIDEKTGLPSGLLVGVKEDGKKSKKYVPASENQDLIAEDWSNLYFMLNKKVFDKRTGKWKNSPVPARYNPYEHSSNSMLNDQFKAAWQRDNLVTVKMYVPVSEDNGAYRAQWSKDPTGWSDWKSGDVATKINKQKDLQRRVYLSRYAAPVEIVPDSEVAQAYKGYIDGTDVAIPDNVVSPNLLAELKKAGVPITESGNVKYSLSDSTGRQLSKEQQSYFKDSAVRDENGNLMVLYHGTQNNFTVFDIARSGENYEGGWSEYGEGIYLTPDKKMAEYYGDNAGWGREVKLMEVYADIKNLFNVNDPVAFDISDLVQKYDLTEFDERHIKRAGDRLVSFLQYHNESVRDYLTSKGYDGVWEKGLNGDVYQVVAYAENQIKNVDNVKPTADPDIRYSLSNEVTEAQNEHGLDAKSEVQFSLSNDTAYMDKAITKNESMLHVDRDIMNTAKALRERIAARMNDIKDRGLTALPDDIEGNTYIANSSYDGTEENTTICPRSLASEAFTDAVSEYLGRPLTVEEQIYISQDLQGRSLTPECTYCYVATDRKAYRAFLGDYVSQRDAVIQKVQDNPNADVTRNGELYKEFLNGRKDTNPMYSRFKMWVDTYKNGKPVIDASHLANINKLMGDINSEFGAELKPQIVDAMKYAQSASWAKKRVNYVAYNGHILNWKQDRINKLNSHYGLRMYSFSDFHPAFVLENMQMITDASVRGLKMLGYTKDTDFVEIFAPSGMNINVSTFGFDVDGNVYENNIIGAEWEKAKALREQYPNVGVTFVATNDTLVNWALEQDWIDVVIPYHLVRTGAEVAKAFGYTNYTSESSDTKTKEWTKGDKKYIAPTEHNNDKATYLAALEKNHLQPRFERFIDNPNYMKLVNECRQPASESKPVQPVFNEDAAMVALAKLEANGYYQPVGGSVDRMYEIAAEVAENMTQALAPARSLSNVGEAQTTYGNYNVYGKDVALETAEDIAPPTVSETEGVDEPVAVSKTETTTEELFPDDLAPAQQELEYLYAERDDIKGAMDVASAVGDYATVNQLMPEYEEVQAKIAEIESADNERLSTLDEADIPPVTDNTMPADAEEMFPDELNEPVRTPDPFEWRDMNDVRKRNVTAYMEENPAVKPFFQQAAREMLGNIQDGMRGKRFYSSEAFDRLGNEGAWTGQSRAQSPDVVELLDGYGFTYDRLETAINEIIDGNGKLHADAKTLEFFLDNRLRNGYETPWGEPIPANQEYIDFLKEQAITERINRFAAEAFDGFMSVADQYAPTEVTEDIAPAIEEKPVAQPVVEDDIAPAYEAIRPQSKKQPRMVKTTPAEQEQIAKILSEEPKPEKRGIRAWAKFKANVLDKGAVFEDLSLRTKNRELMGKWNFMLSSEARAQRLMGNGTEGVKSLNAIREEVDNTGKTKEFYEYMYHRHNVDRMQLAERYEDVPNKPVFGDSVTVERSLKALEHIERANPKFKRYAQDVYNYMNHLRQLLVDNGVISQETADLWADMYPHYVPIRRDGDNGLNINVPLDTNKTGVNAPIKKATGGSRDILPLFDTMAMRTVQTYKAIAKNSFGVELKNTLGSTIANEAQSVDGVIDSIDNQDSLLQEGKFGSNPTFTVFENGDKVTFQITKDMYDALKPTSEGLAYTNKVLNTASNFHRGLLTEYNPVFMLTNAVKDVQDVLMNSQHPARTYLKIPEAYAQMFKKGHWYNEYMENGGEQNTYFDKETNTFDTENKGLKKLLDIPPLSTISAINNFIEMTPRLAEYIASREAGRSIEVSMLDAARVTTNFAAGGDVTKFLNRNGATFLNASVQGAMQQVRNVREAQANGLKGWASLAAKFTLAGLPALLLNRLVWDDDEDYEELSDYVKQNYYIVWKYGDGQFVRIPKGRTVAVIQNAFEQVSNAITGDDEVDLKTFLSLVLSNLAPNNPIENNILSPIIQVANNQTWYGEDLVPTRLQDLPAAEQYDESTDSFSKWLGEKLNVSPIKINYLLDQYTGGIGDTVLPMLTPEAERGNNSFVGNVLAPMKDKFSTDSVMNNQNVSDFYDTIDELTTNAKSKAATDEDVLKYKYMNSVSAEISKLYQYQREVQNSEKYTDEVKYELVRNAQKEIVDLMKEGMVNYENITFSDDYAIIGDRYFQKNDEGEWQKLSGEQVTKYKVTSAAGDAPYATDGTNHYRWYEPGEDSTAEPGWRKITNDQLEKQIEVTSMLGISPEEYWGKKEEYDYAYEHPGNYAVAKVVGGYDAYRSYSSELYDIKADKDEYGKSISGSRKEKVADYINNLDADYGEKIILFKMEYPSDDTYNYEIIDYLNSRDDISYKEMISILRELGFTIGADGVTVMWD